jgi:AraC-like DNA-binding protein
MGTRPEPDVAPRAALVYANFVQFGNGDCLSWPRVESRMLVWCRSGRGEVTVNGAAFRLTPEDYLFLPWTHAIDYEADPRDPFMLGAVHLVPDHAPDRPVRLEVAHHSGAELAGVPWRADADLPGLDGVVSGSFRWNRALGHLAEYIVHAMAPGDSPENWCRDMARVLLLELVRAAKRVSPYSQDIPDALQRMVQFIADRLASPVGLDDLAALSGLSRSTVGRLFRQYLGCSPTEWLLRRRMAEARRLLRSTRMPVSEVGRKVGIHDPYYFSKVFKQANGMPPLAFRKTRGMF